MKFEAYDSDPNSTLFLQESLYKQAVVVAEACELAGLKEKEKTYRHLAAKHAEFIYKHIANRNETREDDKDWDSAGFCGVSSAFRHCKEKSSE